MKITKRGNVPNEIEIYHCNYCGCEFEVPVKERIASFVFRAPNNWPCPECNHNCFSMTRRIDNYSSSKGGKF